MYFCMYDMHFFGIHNFLFRLRHAFAASTHQNVKQQIKAIRFETKESELLCVRHTVALMHTFLYWCVRVHCALFPIERIVSQFETIDFDSFYSQQQKNQIESNQHAARKRITQAKFGNTKEKRVTRACAKQKQP